MSAISITLPDGSQRECQAGQTYSDLAMGIGPGLAKAALAAKVDGELVDLTSAVKDGAQVAIVTAKDPDGLEILRHSTAHILAMAVQKLWPDAQVTIGPVIDNGFYYDFAFPEGTQIGEKDFEKIEMEMKAIVKANHAVTRAVVPREEAVKKFKNLGEHFKVQIIEELPEGEEIKIYGMGDWFDLCRGPHIPTSGKVGAFKLTAIAGAYWRGDEKNQMLTRIYGTAWPSKSELKDYLHRIEEAKKRDHRKLGKELGLFSFHDEAPANAFFHPRGTVVYNKLVDYMRRSNTRYGFREVSTPLIMNVDLWHQSGHYENYRENMYFTKIDETDAAVKPMNCPGHCMIYKNTRHSYRELPMRMSEFGRVHRHERSGVTHGLFRVRTFVQDDAHVFCTQDQIEDEILSVLDQINTVYSDLGFSKVKMELSTRPEKSIGSDEQWQKAEAALASALKKLGKDYQLNPGDGAFYGPKIDFHLIDSLQRSWQCGTVQLDFSMPERFQLEYQGGDNNAHTPVMIHRAVLGSVERFLGIFIEHYAGHFPLWASPEQVRIITVTQKHDDYARATQRELEAAGMRVDSDLRNEKLGYKIREAQLQRVPYMIVVGDKEVEGGTVSPRHWEGEQLEAMTPREFVSKVQSECGELWGL